MMVVPIDDKKEIITIGLYGTEGKDWTRIISTQVDNIKKMYNGFRKAAEARGKKAPKIVLSAYLIPDWSNNSNFDAQFYVKRKKQFLTAFELTLLKNGLSKAVELEDFLGNTYDHEKVYLTNLTARGSNADMIKTHAVIKNQNAHHLQIDSNAHIIDYQDFYDMTFGRMLDSPGVMLNVCHYSSDYAAAQNKIVYTMPGSIFAQRLSTVHKKYCEVHGKDSQDSREKTKANSIYSKDFTVALEQCGLVKSVAKGGKRTVYVADMFQSAWGLTPLIFSAVNQSWRSASTELLTPVLEKFNRVAKEVSVVIHDAVCDYACFRSALKKHTEQLSLHSSPFEIICDLSNLDKSQLRQPMRLAMLKMLKGKKIREGEALDMFRRLGSRGKAFATEQSAHDALMQISDVKKEHKLIYEYFSKLIKTIAKKYSASEYYEGLVKIAADLIPDTPRGNKLTGQLFGCRVDKLHGYLLQSKEKSLLEKLCLRYFSRSSVELAHVKSQLKTIQNQLKRDFGDDHLMIEETNTRVKKQKKKLLNVEIKWKICLRNMKHQRKLIALCELLSANECLFQ